ncbi:MAG: Fpg/Nei family DNA glycosylase [Acidimicrobiia bacterium]
MPEIIEVEAARRLIEDRALAREIASVFAPDAWFLKRGLTPPAAKSALRGRMLTAARRRGKLMLVDTDDGTGPVLGLHLGMSGRVLVDDEAAGDPLIYASNRVVPAWHRFGLEFADGGSLFLRDPRRLGGVELDPNEERLGVDAFEITSAQLTAVVEPSRAPVKAVLMNQARVAGLGNLLVDEVLWRAGVDPARPASTLNANDRRRLHRAIVSTLRVTTRRGGSHTGDLPRVAGEPCPKDGTAIVRRTIAGRTTFSCPEHQR